jgi:hypothetical protein
MFVDKGRPDWRADAPRLIARKLLRRITSAWWVLRVLEALEHTLPRLFPGARRPLRRWIIGGYLWQGYRQGLRELS